MLSSTKGVFIDHILEEEIQTKYTLEINYFGIDCIAVPGNLLK